MRAPKITKTIRVDAKGRVNLGVLPEEISGFKLTTDKSGRYILEPLSEIPTREMWLHKNPEAMASLDRGLKELGEGKKGVKMSFVKYLKD